MRKQCAKCPWKTSTDPYDIPNGYDVKKHEKLSRTIARPGELRLGGHIRMMACHETSGGDLKPCVGWLDNQLGEGNNILLRLLVASGRIDGNVQTVGPQHRTLEETLPKKKKKK